MVHRVVFCRYGRVPKPTQLLAYPSKEDASFSSSETTPAVRSPASAARPKPKCSAKRGATESGQESKKPKLITLRASQSDYSDEELDQQSEPEEMEEEQQPPSSPSKDSAAPVFVPASLRSPPPVISVVEETMEEVRETISHFLLHRHISSHINFYILLCVFMFIFCILLHFIIQTLHFDNSPHPTLSLISWPVCPMCCVSRKMHCALMRRAQLNHVNISWTCWL